MTFTVIVALIGLTLSAAGAGRPNVVLIMADDLGYHDLSCYGHPRIKTPHLDGLAQEGTKLTGFYAGATICTPSRIALLTGAYPARLGWTKGVVGHLMPAGRGLNPEALTMAEIFKSQGYRTGMFGKWHLGDELPFRPHRQGFEVTFYINKSNNQTRELWRGDEVVERPFVNRMLTEQFTGEAIKFIRENQANPFFLYLPYSAPHFPVEAHPAWKGTSAFGVYGDVVEEMDARIGEILGALESENLARKTIVVFLSDNGPEPLTKESSADPYRGKKWSALEGGTRVPCLLRWPGMIPQRQERDALVGAIDLLPTLCRACGIDLQKVSRGSPLLDGVDLWDSLCGKEGAPHPRHDLLYWHGADGFQAIRVGAWKLFLQRKDAQLKSTGQDAPVLFHLAADPMEKEDLAARHPERVKAMRELAEKRLAEIMENAIPLGAAAQ